VELNEVASYLSAADVAFSLHRPGPSKIAISPIKNAEYFANGLPVIAPKGVGDDAFMIEQWDLGVTFDLDEVGRQAIFNNVTLLMVERHANSRIAQWAEQHRSFSIVAKHYDTMILDIKGR